MDFDNFKFVNSRNDTSVCINNDSTIILQILYFGSREGIIQSVHNRFVSQMIQVVFSNVQLIKFTWILRLPYEWRAPIPYIASSLFLYSIPFYGAMMFIVTISLYIGFCVFGIAFVHDIQLNLQDLNAGVFNEHINITAEKRIEMKDKFCDIIRFHIAAKQLNY